MDATSFSQNSYFYDAAEEVLTATRRMVAEFYELEKRKEAVPAVYGNAAE